MKQSLTLWEEVNAVPVDRIKSSDASDFIGILCIEEAPKTVD